MARPRKDGNDKLPAGIYCKYGKSGNTYFTLIKGKYVGLGTKLDEAEQQLAAMLGNPIMPETIADLAERFIRHINRQIAEQSREALARRTVEDYTDALRKRLIPVFGTMKPTSFKPTHAAQYLARPENQKRKVGANRDIAALGSMFSYAMSIGAVESHPCRGVRRNREFARKRRVTVAELNAFLEVADSMGPGYTMIGLIGAMVGVTGRRRAEILTLHRNNLSPNGITTKESKVKAGGVARTFVIPWTPVVAGIVEKAQARKLREKTASMFVFPTRDGTPYTDQGFKGMWHRIMLKYVEGGGEWFTAHDLRALYVTETLARGNDPHTHQNLETMRRVYEREANVTIKPLA